MIIITTTETPLATVSLRLSFCLFIIKKINKAELKEVLFFTLINPHYISNPSLKSLEIDL